MLAIWVEFNAYHVQYLQLALGKQENEQPSTLFPTMIAEKIRAR